jgi:imidazole glycerol-phosphate synthase subunit HisH
MIDIAVVDYGMGNLRSVAKALEHVASDAKISVTDSAQQIREAKRVVFPGQGAMPDCMREMEARGLREPLLEAAGSKPFLGICIGLQMLFEWSEEGGVKGLGVLPGKVRRFPKDEMINGKGAKLKVPHMGWNQVEQKKSHALWAGISPGSRFYFVHSYFVEAGDVQQVTGVSRYPFAFTCAVACDNIFAVQFHPEKSQTAGLRLLANFVKWNGKVQVEA